MTRGARHSRSTRRSRRRYPSTSPQRMWSAWLHACRDPLDWGRVDAIELRNWLLRFGTSS
eukprot:6611149-Ditylum_brightwellii.AAC.1